MNDRLLSALLEPALLLAALGAPFAAAANTGPYNGIEGGGNRMAEQDVRRNDQTLFTYGFKEGFVGGMVFGYSSSSGVRPELELDYRRDKYAEARSGTSSTSNVGGHEDAYTVMTNLWFDITTDDGVFNVLHPYIGGGIGAARVAAHEPSLAGVVGRSSFDTLFAYQAGAGIDIDLTQSTTLTFDYRYVQSDEGTFDNNFGPVKARYRADSAMLGLRFSYGHPEPADETPQAVRVVQLPLPTPPRDSDGDGVNDLDDRCPGTPPGFKVDRAGCIAEQTLVLHDINFETNSDQLTAAAQDTLAGVAAALAAQPALRIEIVGHTDSVGSSARNLKLSQARAGSVRKYLVAKGLSAGSLRARGAGETSPIAGNDTAEGRAENRRVEFIVVSQPGK